MTLSDHLRRISDGPVDAIDADHLKHSALLLEKMAGVVEAAQWARNRLERIADDSWHGDGRDFKRSLDGVFLDFDAALERAGSRVPDHLLRVDAKEQSGE